MYDTWEDPVGPYDGSIVMDAPPPPDLAITGWSPLPDWADPLFGTAPVGADVAGNPVVLMDDDYLDYGREKASGDVMLSGGIGDEEEDLPDGGTVDDVIVTGDLRDRDSPSIVGPGFTPGGSGVVIGGDPTTVDPGPTPPPSSEPEFPEVQQSFLDALREFINQNRAREEVGDRNANSRFNRDPSNQTDIRVGSTTVYWDTSTQSFWFDSDGDGSTPETEFWVYGDGVWYDYNNDGNPDTRVVSF